MALKGTFEPELSPSAWFDEDSVALLWFGDDAGPVEGLPAITGTLEVTTDAATLAATGAVLVEALVDFTTDAATLASTGTTQIAGALAGTLANATLAAEADNLVTGALVATTDDATLASTGAVLVEGLVDTTTDDATLAAFGEGEFVPTPEPVTNTVTGGAGLWSDGVTEDERPAITAIFLATTDDATLTATGHMPRHYSVELPKTAIQPSNPPAPRHATLDVTTDDATLLATGTVSRAAQTPERIDFVLASRHAQPRSTSRRGPRLGIESPARGALRAGARTRHAQHPRGDASVPSVAYRRRLAG